MLRHTRNWVICVVVTDNGNAEETATRRVYRVLLLLRPRPSCFSGCLVLLMLSHMMGHQWHSAYASLLYLKIKRCFKQVGGSSTAFCFLRHRFFFLLLTVSFTMQREWRQRGNWGWLEVACWGHGFPRELSKDMGRVGSKASVQSHQLDEGNVFYWRNIHWACQSMPGTMEKHTGSWNQDYKHIEVGDIHNDDSWLLAGKHTMCRGLSVTLCVPTSVPGGRVSLLAIGSTYSKNFIGRNWGSVLMYLLFYVF